MSDNIPKQVVTTTVFGSHAEQLDRTFISFAQNQFLELHAFVIGEDLPKNQIPGIHYHLKKPDPSYSSPIRDADFRRWEFIDELDAPYAMVVDGHDVLCLQSIPQIPTLLKGGILGLVVEHAGGRYLEGGIYTGNFFNAGVTFWNVEKSRELRQKVIERGKIRYRNDVDDQLSLNEIIHAYYLDEITILPTTYNYRCYVKRQKKGWATTGNLDGVKIYHTDECDEAAQMLPVKPLPPIAHLDPDGPEPLDKNQQWQRRLAQRVKKHLVR